MSVGGAARVGYHAAHIGTLIWYFLNGAFGMFDLSCSSQTRLVPVGHVAQTVLRARLHASLPH